VIFRLHGGAGKFGARIGNPERRKTMPRDIIAQGETIQDLRNLAATMAANSAEYPHLEPPLVQLEGLLGQMGPLIILQADLAAQRQETSKKLRELLTGARRLGSFLRAGLKQHYGPRSEKLAAFRLLPFRGRKPAKPEEPVNPPAPAPAAPGPQAS
jgi:hypothetical protein